PGAPVSIALTRYQTAPTAPSAAAHAARASIRPGRASSARATRSGSAKTAVTFAPTASASASPASAGARGPGLTVQYAHAARNDATTRSFSAVQDWVITTGSPAKTAAPKSAPRASDPIRRASP